MLLTQIWHYVQKREQLPLKDISAHFRISEDAVVQAVETLESLGKVHYLNSAASCSSGQCHDCNVCDTGNEFDQLWIEAITLKPGSLPLQIPVYSIA